MKFAYICFAGLSHLDWGGVKETLSELQHRGHDIFVLSGTNLRAYLATYTFKFIDVCLDDFRARKPDETIEDTLAYHQVHNFCNVKNVRDSVLAVLGYHAQLKFDMVLSDPLCKTGPLVAMKTGLPYAVLGPYDYVPEGRVKQDNSLAAQNFLKEFKIITDEIGIPDGYKLPFLQNSPLLNIAYSTPEFDCGMEVPNVTHVGSDDLTSKVKYNKPSIFYSSGTIFWDQTQVDAVISAAKAFKDVNFHITKSRIMPEVEELENVFVYDFCDDKKMVGKMHLLLTQGGLGTVTNGIRAAVPQIVMPLFWYNMPQAIKVAKYGNGIALFDLDEQVRGLENAIGQVLSNGRFAKKSVELWENFLSYGGSRAAADLIEGK